MTWLTWRQFRAQAITGAAVLAVLAIALGITGPHLAHLYASSGLATCQAHGNCGPLVTAFTAQVKASTIDELLFILCIGLLLAAPALIGVFWGAPLVAREIDLTLDEIVQRLLRDRGVITTDSSVDRFFKRHRVTFKKNFARRRTGAA